MLDYHLSPHSLAARQRQNRGQNSTSWEILAWLPSGEVLAHFPPWKVGERIYISIRISAVGLFEVGMLPTRWLIENQPFCISVRKYEWLRAQILFEFLVLNVIPFFLPYLVRNIPLEFVLLGLPDCGCIFKWRTLKPLLLVFQAWLLFLCVFFFYLRRLGTLPVMIVPVNGFLIIMLQVLHISDAVLK